jgi:hypothetical protein
MARTNTVLMAVIFCAGYCLGASPDNASDTIAKGMHLEATAASREVNLENGVNLHLSPGSVGTAFSDRMVLEQGAVRVAHFNGYTIQAGQLQVQSTDLSAQAVVRMTNKTIEIASVGGGLNVTEGGAMLTRVVSGTRSSFQQSGASGSTGAAPGPKKLPSDHHVMIWMIGITAAAALTIGLTAASQGKSPF